jgi:hypothetical protein
MTCILREADGERRPEDFLLKEILNAMEPFQNALVP